MELDIKWNPIITKTYDVIKSLDEFERTLNVGNDASIYVSDTVIITKEHQQTADNRNIKIYIVSGLPDIRVTASNKVLNKPLA